MNEADEVRQRVDIGRLEPRRGIGPAGYRIAPFGTSVDPGDRTEPDL